MSSTLPTGVRALLGLAAIALEEVRKFPETLPTVAATVPVGAISTAMQASLKFQQQVAVLASRGDEVISQFRGSHEDPPAWATFDDDPADADGAGDAPGTRPLAAFERIDYQSPSDEVAPDGLAGDDLAAGLPRPAVRETTASKPSTPAAKKAPAKKEPAKKEPAKKAPAGKVAATDAPATKAPGAAVPADETGPASASKAPAKKAAAKKPKKAAPLAPVPPLGGPAAGAAATDPVLQAGPAIPPPSSGPAVPATAPGPNTPSGPTLAGADGE